LITGVKKMKNLKLLITIPFVIVSVFSMLASPAHSGTYTFSAGDLGDLDHEYYFKWGINWNLPGGETITGATLTYNNIWDWTVETDHLYTHLLNSAPPGVNSWWDGEGGNDNFGGQGFLLGDWNDPNGGSPSTFDLIYTIPSSYFSWLSDGNFGFGIDPDCHYYNSGITFEITTTTEAPEPATLLLLGSGLLGLAGLARRRFKKN
jgi:hypothetical protein